MQRYPRDMIGHGPDRPDPRWPGDAKVAVQFREYVSKHIYIYTYIYIYIYVYIFI